MSAKRHSQRPSRRCCVPRPIPLGPRVRVPVKDTISMAERAERPEEVSDDLLMAAADKRRRRAERLRKQGLRLVD